MNKTSCPQRAHGLIGETGRQRNQHRVVWEFGEGNVLKASGVG